MLERLQKIIARAGIASRRHAEQLIVSGQVRVNGQIVTELGSKADPEHDRIEAAGKLVESNHRRVYIVLNKPPEVVATMADPEGRKTLRNCLKGLPERVYPVGRLDYDASGVLFLTNDGDLAAAMLKDWSHLEQLYHVKIKGRLVMSDLDRLGRNAGAEFRTIRQPDASRGHAENFWYEVNLQDSKKDILRRVLFAEKHPVEKLKRIGLGPLNLEGLPQGRYRLLNEKEVAGLRTALKIKPKPRTYYAPRQESQQGEAPSENAAAANQLTPSPVPPRQNDSRSQEFAANSAPPDQIVAASSGKTFAPVPTAAGRASFTPGRPLYTPRGSGRPPGRFQKPVAPRHSPHGKHGPRPSRPAGFDPFDEEDDDIQRKDSARPGAPRTGAPFRHEGPRPSGTRFQGPRPGGPPRGAPRGDRPHRPSGPRNFGAPNRPSGDRPERPPRPGGPRGFDGPNRSSGPSRPSKWNQGGSRGDGPPSGGPRGDRPTDDRPDRPFRPSGPRSGRPSGDRPYGDRPSGDRSNRPFRPSGPPRGGRPSGDRPYGDRPDRPPRPGGSPGGYGSRPSGPRGSSRPDGPRGGRPDRPSRPGGPSRSGPRGTGPRGKSSGKPFRPNRPSGDRGPRGPR